jgi:hypothetical protein
MKLGIALPITDRREENDFWLSFLMMDKPNFSLYLPDFPAGDYHESISAVRNNLVLQAIRDECTHLLMCDTDQAYPQDAFTKLLSHDKLMVGAVVHRRYPPFEPIINRGELGRYVHVPDDEIESGDLIEVDSTGAGCLLFNMDVFFAVEQPWFENTTIDGKVVGEDIHFCAKVKEVGIPIHIDTSILIDHLTMARVNRTFYKMYKKFNNIKWKEQEDV